MVTLIETKQETFRSRFKGEHKDGGRYVASGGLAGRYIAGGSKPRRLLLVFVVKYQRKLRLRRKEKRYDEDSKENERKTLFRPDRSLHSEWRVGLSSVAT
ncbi:hypothetical protein Bca4012_089954 [Brassica carinata]